MPDVEERLAKLERSLEYIERSVDLCVNALREIARTHCPRLVVSQIESDIDALRQHKP